MPKEWAMSISPEVMMSEEKSQEVTESVEVEVKPEAPEPKMFDEAYVKKLRDEAAGYRVKLKEFEDANKSELERAQEDAEKARRELVEVQGEAARLRVAAKYGIGEDHLDLLTGADEEELEVRAEKLASLIRSGSQPERKGARAPFDPDEGKSPSSNAGSSADRFAAALEESGF